MPISVSTTIEKSTCFARSPPSKPNSPIVLNPICFAIFTAFIKFADLPEALENNYNFPLRCNFRPLFSSPILPNISSEKGGNADDILKKDSLHGLRIKFESSIPGITITDAVWSVATPGAVPNPVTVTLKVPPNIFAVRKDIITSMT